MVRLSVENLAISKIEKLPNSNNLTQNFAHYNNNDSLKLPKYIFKAKVAKFRQISSQW